ncbi:MAG: MarR family transcriptional regulator [Saprospiraceae bacterium]|nr:MarR family transcriptional regulator [Saprospiraceae bacterium]
MADKLTTINKTKTEVPGFILERTAKRMKQYFQRALAAAETGITIDQWVILQRLHVEDGISQLDLAKATYKDAPTVTRIIDLLDKKELTRRVPDEQDRRRFKIQLTAKGKEKIEEVLPIIKEARMVAWEGLSDEQITQLEETLNTVFENLEF